MNRFSVGQKIVALKDAPPDTPESHYVQYRKNKFYIVDKFCFCSRCGEQLINIGIPIDDFNGLKTDTFWCDACHSKQHASPDDWCNARDFAPVVEVDDLINSALAVEEKEVIVENCDYGTDY